MKTKLSKKSKYYISKERRMELIHFCMQYPDWVNERSWLTFNPNRTYVDLSEVHGGRLVTDYTPDTVEAITYLSFCINLVDEAADETDPVLGSYIRYAAIHGLAYDQLNALDAIPCCRNVFYEYYRKFYWILDQKLRHALTFVV